jgi:hypothetical protein
MNSDETIRSIARSQLNKYISAYSCIFTTENVGGATKMRWGGATRSGDAQPAGFPTCAKAGDKSRDGCKGRWRSKFTITK